MAKQGDYVQLLRDVDGYLVPRIPEGTHGVVVEAYEAPVEGYAVDVGLRDPSTGERVYDNVILRPEQFRVLPHACGLNIDAELERALVALIEDALKGSACGRAVLTDAVAIELEGPLPKETAREARGSRDFNYTAHIEGKPGVPLDDVVWAVAALLSALWDRRIPAVARCAYAGRLPDRGGYERWEVLSPAEGSVT
ncbi:MAG: hypothetical protein M3Q48_09045 [Actinomycetota bacterium]|nr:hypothetical protein [Actinomycetota bacterium]